MQIGTRVQVAGHGPGMLAMDNEDGTWNVEFDSGTEADIPEKALSICEDQSLKHLEIAKEEKIIDMPSGVRVVKHPFTESKPDGWTRFVCFSDTHGKHNEIPDSHRPAGDVLLHAGDFTNTGELEQIESFNEWLKAYPAGHAVVIAGNHDITLHEAYYKDRGAARFHRAVAPDGLITTNPYDCQKAREMLKCCTYLEDSGIEVNGYTIYGSPWQPEFCDWAFQLQTAQALRDKWAQIPENVDVLITHTPPKGYGDFTSSGLSAGCEELRTAIEQRVVPVNLSGHIHNAYGCSADEVTLYINASTCTHSYKPVNAPIVFDLPPPSELRVATAQAAAQRRESLKT